MNVDSSAPEPIAHTSPGVFRSRCEVSLLVHSSVANDLVGCLGVAAHIEHGRPVRGKCLAPTGSQIVRVIDNDRVQPRSARQLGVRASPRSIAHRAGVSLGMIQRQFPSKQDLQEECDVHVLAVLRSIKDRGVVGGSVTEPAFMTAAHEALGPLLPSVTMAMLNDTATQWFDDLAELYENALTSGELGESMSADEDVQAIIAVYTAMQLGVAMLAKHIYHRLGAEELDPSTMARMTRARLPRHATPPRSGHRKPDPRRTRQLRTGPARQERPMTTNKPALTKVQETLLLTLYFRAIDARSRAPLVGDQWAEHVLDQIDYNRLELATKYFDRYLWLLRTKALDSWTTEFLRTTQRNRTALGLRPGQPRLPNRCATGNPLVRC